MYDAAILAHVIGIIINQSTRNCAGEMTIDPAKFIEEKCGRYARGKHAGQLRGWATWTYVLHGGWTIDGPGAGNGHVVRPGQFISLVVADFNGNPYFTL